MGIWTSKIKGASFCQVERISPVVRVSPCSTSGSQVWRGAKPSFIDKAMIARVVGMGWVISWISHCPVSQALVRLANSKVAAAVA